MSHDRHILVVDDDPAIREAVRRFLSRNGYEIVTASDGTEALDVLARRGGNVDLLLTDLTMPGMGGRALITRARADYPALRVICMSGYAEREASHTEEATPLASYIEKPFSLGTLGRLVRSTLDQPVSP